MFGAEIVTGGAIGFVGAAALEVVPALRAGRRVALSERPVGAGLAVASVVALAGLLGAPAAPEAPAVNPSAVHAPAVSSEAPVLAAGEPRTSGARLLAAGRVGAEGGEVVVIDPSSPLNGTRVEIPEGALRSPETIRISERATLPGPMPRQAIAASTVLVLTKETPGTFRKPVVVTMPTNLAQGSPVPVYWDEEVARYRAVTLRSIDRANNRITFDTVHFTDFMSWVVNLFSGGKKAKLSAVTTDFKPENDSFFMANRGDYASEGNCLGMSIFAAWYSQHARALGAPALRDRFVKAGTAQDPGELHDVAEREIASYLQHSANQINSFLAQAGGFLTGATITGTNLIAALQATQEPQVMLLRNAKNEGHAVVVYGYVPETDSKPGHFLISDPNYPGETMTYDFDTQNGFSNYSSTDELYKNLTLVSYTSYSSLMSTSQLEAALKAGDDRFKEGVKAAPSAAREPFVTITTDLPRDEQGRVHVAAGEGLVITGSITGGDAGAEHPVKKIVAYVNDARVTDGKASVGSSFSLAVTPPAGATSFTVTLVAEGLWDRTDDSGTTHTEETYAGQADLAVEIDAPAPAPASAASAPSTAPAAASRGFVGSLGAVGGS